MALRSVKMSEEVWLTCLSHALTTETEEIMGLLLGDIQNVGGNMIALIWGASPQMRSDRRKDRVETNPELLAAASAQAEHRMTLTTGRTTRVIGWYHSHPHITVLPSHVDVRTQAMYQLLDPGFIGLIFSCFSEDAQKVGRIQVIAFQSLDGKARNVSPVGNGAVIELESSRSVSVNALSKPGSPLLEDVDQDTGDSLAVKTGKVGGRAPLGEAVSHADVNTTEKHKVGGNAIVVYSPDLNNIGNAVDSPEVSEGLQEALHRSNLDMSGAEYVRKEVRLEVLPASSLLKLDHPLTSFTEMQQVLLEEERSAYTQAILNNLRDGKIHPLIYVHHTSTYQASLCKLMEYCLSPAINALQDRLMENEFRLAMLMDEANSLEKELARKREKTPESLQRWPSSGSRGNMPTVHSPVGARSSSNVGNRRKGC